MTRISFIGFGEAGRAWADTLKLCGQLEIRAYDILLDTERAEEFAAAAAKRNVDLASSAGQAIDEAKFVISSVTASQCLEAAKTSARTMVEGQTYFDINSVSPECKRQAAAAISRAGARYIDMAVMAPVHPAGHRTPVLLAGMPDSTDIEFLDACGFAYEIVGDTPGIATGIKMIRSLFVKGLEALTVQTLAAAQKVDSTEIILASLAKSYPGLSWDRFAAYQFERVARHGIRRAAEMRECATTYGELGFGIGAAMATAIADIQQAIGESAIETVPVYTPLEWAERTMRHLKRGNAERLS